MDGFKEKKWFVYLGDHHEGPFSLEEIQTKITGGQLTATNYIWAEGMPDWKMMSEVQTFEEVIKNGQAAMAPPGAPISSNDTPPFDAPQNAFHEGPSVSSPAVQTVFATHSDPSLAPALATAAAVSLETAPENPPEAAPAFEAIPVLETASPALSALQPALETGGPSIHLEAASPNPHFGKPADHRHEHAPTAPTKKRPSPVIKWVGVAAIVGGVGVAYMGGYFSPVTNSPAMKVGVQAASSIFDPFLNTLGDKIPLLGQWISPIPPLDDVTKEEYEQLKASAKGNLDGTGPQLGIALSQADLFSPSFYMSTNLPDGATFAVYIDGIPETLLNQLSFSAVGQATVTKHLAKFTALKSSDGKPFPRGKYTVYLLLPDTQIPTVKPYTTRLQAINAVNLPFTLPPNSRIVMTRSYFLGGPRDATYTTRLKEFHDKLTARAQAELVECKQFSSLLESQLVGSKAKFTSLRKGKRITPAQKKAWAEYHKSWSTLSDQLVQAFAKMTPETLHNDYFYGSLYLASQQASQAVGRYHDIQNSFFTANADPKSFEIQLGEAESVATAALNELKAKIDRIEKLPPNPNGMPVRDTL
jgi:hypothetical protein